MKLKSFGKYTITTQLDQSRWLTVYRAVDPAANRPVILKVFEPASQTGASDRFLAALRPILGLYHPYIARVYEVNVVDDRPFLAVEAVDDQTLADHLSQRRSAKQVGALSAVGRPLHLIAEALDYAHAQGVVHGNLTPTHILLTDVAEPILTGFGLGALLSDLAAQGKPDQSDLGLAAYTSPEQAAGQPGDVLSDLYALGVILYEWVTGRPPFIAGSPADILAQHRAALPPPPRALNVDLPETAQAVILKALAKEPGRRFSSAGALARAFAAALADPAGQTEASLASETPAGLLEPDVAETSLQTEVGRPQQIGRFKIEAELGQRGHVVVYRAYDSKLERQVALKVLLPQFVTSAELSGRFQREVEVIAALEHPYIVKVYNFGDYRGRPYVVMPYLAGGTLRIRLQDGPLDPPALAAIIERVAAALDEAHAHGIIHAQIRPDNILFDAQGQAYLSDFSIAALSETWADITGRDNTDRAASYMSPEQVQALIQGETPRLDARSDVYALGVVIFEALTGQVPYQAATPDETAQAHLNAPIPSLRRLKANLRPGYQSLIERALAKNPADRYATTGEVAARMKELLAGRWYISSISDLIKVPDLSGKTQSEPSTGEGAEPASPGRSQAALSFGSQFGRYRLEKELGRGAMGIVYLAYDPITKRQVALKVLSDRLATTPDFRKRFEAEARMIALLDHDSIAPIYDFGDDEGHLFLVIPYLSGGTLADRLARKPLKARQIARIIERMATALDTAHANNIIHRDVKPGNILFNKKGEAFLSDFGISIIQESTAGQSIQDNMGGTPNYMSPEQVKIVMNETPLPRLDGRSDIYALGVVLFEMLTGQVPFPAGTPLRIVMAHLNEPIPRLVTIKPGLSSAWQEVIDLALAKEPDQRYQTAQALAEDVKDLASGGWYLRQLLD